MSSGTSWTDSDLLRGVLRACIGRQLSGAGVYSKCSISSHVSPPAFLDSPHSSASHHLDSADRHLPLPRRPGCLPQGRASRARSPAELQLRLLSSEPGGPRGTSVLTGEPRPGPPGPLTQTSAPGHCHHAGPEHPASSPCLTAPGKGPPALRGTGAPAVHPSSQGRGTVMGGLGPP